MEQYIIKGGNPLVGEVVIGGDEECSTACFSCGSNDRRKM